MARMRSLIVVGELAGRLDQLVELEVQVAEVLADHVPVGLLAHDVQVDHVDRDPLQVGGASSALKAGLKESLLLGRGRRHGCLRRVPGASYPRATG